MFAALVALLSLALVARAQIITPASAVQCEPVLITWTATNSPPYIVSIIPGGQVSAAAIENLGTFTNTSVTWIVDIPAGTSLTLQLRDGTGQPIYSAPFNIQSSSDTSCLGTNAGYVGGAGLPAKSGGSASGSSTAAGSSSGSSTSGSATSASSTSSRLGTSTSASSVSVASGTSTSSTSSKSSTSSGTSTSHSTTASSPTTSPSSAAMPHSAVDFGLAGIAGLLGALLFA